MGRAALSSESYCAGVGGEDRPQQQACIQISLVSRCAGPLGLTCQGLSFLTCKVEEPYPLKCVALSKRRSRDSGLSPRPPPAADPKVRAPKWTPLFPLAPTAGFRRAGGKPRPRPPAHPCTRAAASRHRSLCGILRASSLDVRGQAPRWGPPGRRGQARARCITWRSATTGPRAAPPGTGPFPVVPSFAYTL